MQREPIFGYVGSDSRRREDIHYRRLPGVRGVRICKSKVVTPCLENSIRFKAEVLRYFRSSAIRRLSILSGQCGTSASGRQLPTARRSYGAVR